MHRFLLLDATPEACKDIEWLKPYFMTENGELRLSIHALVVETPSYRIIVDTCFGNDKQRENERSNMLCGSFLRDLEAPGFRRAVSIMSCVLTFTLTMSGGTRCLSTANGSLRLKTHATSLPVANTITGLGIGKSNSSAIIWVIAWTQCSPLALWIGSRPITSCAMKCGSNRRRAILPDMSVCGSRRRGSGRS